MPGCVCQLDTDNRLAGNRGNYPDAVGPEGQGQVISKGGHLVDLNPWSRRIFVHCNNRSGAYLYNVSGNSKVQEFFLK